MKTESNSKSQKWIETKKIKKGWKKWDKESKSKRLERIKKFKMIIWYIDFKNWCSLKNSKLLIYVREKNWMQK